MFALSNRHDPEAKARDMSLNQASNELARSQLQVNINTVINELQQLTANPQTDSRQSRACRAGSHKEALKNKRIAGRLLEDPENWSAY